MTGPIMRIEPAAISRELSRLVATTSKPPKESRWVEKVLAARELPQWARLAERAGVQEARLAGLSWAEIGKDLGMTKQAAWDRYAPPEDSDPDDGQPPPVKRRPRPMVKFTLAEAKVLVSVLEELDTKPAQALAQAGAERIAELLADMAGDELPAEEQTGMAPKAHRLPRLIRLQS